MTIWKLAPLLAVVAFLAGGCKDDKSASGASATATGPAPTSSTNAAVVRGIREGLTNLPPVPSKAQPKLTTLKLWVGPEELITEIASTEKEVMTGMMHRTSMEENEAMLFVFAYPHQTAFWMKNTVMPLSCAYIDPDGIILETHDMKALDETPITAATNRVQYVLETKQGWFDRHNVKPGALIRTERGNFSHTFFNR